MVRHPPIMWATVALFLVPVNRDLFFVYVTPFALSAKRYGLGPLVVFKSLMPAAGPSPGRFTPLEEVLTMDVTFL